MLTKQLIWCLKGNNLELLDALYDTLSDSDSLDTDHLLKIPSQRRRSPSLSEERSKYEVTAKVFVTGDDYENWSAETLNDALACLRRTTCLDSVDSLILSFNGILNDANDSKQRLDAAARVWKVITLSISLHCIHSFLSLYTVTHPRFPKYRPRCCRFRSDRTGQFRTRCQR